MTPRWWRAGESWHAEAVDAAAMRDLGASLARELRPGDLIVLDGPLGAGKTTFVQGLGAGLQVRGAVTSPTFVIARIHRGPRADLVHVDAYRLADTVEVEDLDLDAQAEESVMVVEWGAGKVEGLAEQRLVVTISRPVGGDRAVDGAAGPDSDGAAGPVSGRDEPDPAGGVREVVVRGVGRRWADLNLGG